MFNFITHCKLQFRNGIFLMKIPKFENLIELRTLNYFSPNSTQKIVQYSTICVGSFSG